jgi:hypothetical protein
VCGYALRATMTRSSDRVWPEDICGKPVTEARCPRPGQGGSHSADSEPGPLCPSWLPYARGFWRFPGLGTPGDPPPRFSRAWSRGPSSLGEVRPVPFAVGGLLFPGKSHPHWGPGVASIFSV